MDKVWASLGLVPQDEALRRFLWRGVRRQKVRRSINV